MSKNTWGRFNTVMSSAKLTIFILLSLRAEAASHRTNRFYREQRFTQSKIENTGGLRTRQSEESHRLRPYSCSDLRAALSGSLSLPIDKRKIATQHIPAGMSRIKLVTKMRSSRYDPWWNPKSPKVAIVAYCNPAIAKRASDVMTQTRLSQTNWNGGWFWTFL